MEISYKELVLVVLLGIVGRVLSSQSCFGCQNGCQLPPPQCIYGVVRDICGCCYECGKGPLQECGGGLAGRCGDGLECSLPPPAPPSACVDGFECSPLPLPPPPGGPQGICTYSWTLPKKACILGNNRRKIRRVRSMDACIYRCLAFGWCNSVEYKRNRNLCFLSEVDSKSPDYKQPCPSRGNKKTIFSEKTDTFTIDGQTFLVLKNRQGSTWDEARQLCIEWGGDLGGDLAQPNNGLTTLKLAAYLFRNYGMTYYWLGGRGNGSSIAWNEGIKIEHSPLWGTDYLESENYCIFLRDDSGPIPIGVIGVYPCLETDYFVPLCERRSPPDADDSDADDSDADDVSDDENDDTFDP